MLFTLLEGRIAPNARARAFLVSDSWDDWFEFSTLYSLIYVDAEGGRHPIGGVKIGQFRMRKRRPAIPERFNALDDKFFSLGQDDTYYEKLNQLGDGIRDRILQGLRDVAIDPELYHRALNERVTGLSLLRSVTKSTVTGQFRRLAAGGVRLSEFRFQYAAPGTARTKTSPFRIEFEVTPNSEPPTNIHVLIGRNGVGKTRLLHLMTRALVEPDADAREVGRFSEPGNDSGSGLFVNLVSVTFSAFDPFEPLPTKRNKATGMQYVYVGLKRVGTTESGGPLPPKSLTSMSREFVESVKACRVGAKSARWRRALHTLETDTLFRDSNVADLVNVEDDELKERAGALFKDLSSGHKIVLLTITRLVEAVEERSLVLLDEPEAHLHPPLLSAFVRALSDLLTNRNGVAIIATHSPVVLQEVPKNCVWKMRRSGREVVVERPDIETFGENSGTLTSEVFRLEATHSGFHQLIREAIEEGLNYEDTLARFGGAMGSEAKAIVRSIIAARKAGEHS